MDAVIVANTASHQGEHATAMRAGFVRHGVSATIKRDWRGVRADVVVCWGWRIGAALRSLGNEVLVMERGYLGDRFRWTSLGWNGLNGRAEFATRDDPRRFEQHHSLAPWRLGGECIVLCGQVPHDASLQGQNLGSWYRAQAVDLARRYGLPVVFRPHPLARHGAYPPMPVPTSRLTLAEDLGRAALVATFNSNTGVDAVAAGVPVLVADCGSMAHCMSSRLGEFNRAPREAWAARLAWRQFLRHEIESGFAWEVARERMREAA